MTILDITLELKPYSVNKYFYGNRSIKRREAVEWEVSVIDQLRTSEIQDNIQKFKDVFDPKTNCIEVELKYYYPKKILITKDGKISSRAFDLSNVEKPLIDVIFLQKYCTDSCKNLEIDDKYITKLTSSKHSAINHKIHIKIQLKDLQAHLNTEQL